MLKIYCSFLFFFFSVLSFGQKFSFVTYNTEEGLPQSQVTCINQDESGYLWVGTLGGLARFNGSEFKSYSSIDGLVNNRITTLKHFDGAMWVGHDGGISKIVKEQIKSITFEGNDKSRNVSDIIKFKGQIYVCSNGGGLFIVKNNKLVNVKLSGPDYERVRGGKVFDGVLYLATRGGILTSTDGKTFKQLPLQGDYSYSSISGTDELMVFTTYNDGVFKVNRKNGRRTFFSAEKLQYSIYGSYIDVNGTLWLNTQDGIINISSKNEISFLDESKGLPVNMISCFFQDKDNNIWIGSQGRGLIRFPGEKFRYFEQSSGLPTDLFLTGFQAQNGEFYLGTYDKGLVVKAANGTINQIDVDETTIWASLQNVDGKNWFGTTTSLVSIDANRKIEKYTYEDNVPGLKITALYRIDHKSMYVGGSDGMSIYKGGKFKKLGSPTDEYIGTVRDIEVVNGQLFCVSNLGVFYYDGKSFKVYKGIENVVYSIEKDDKNNLWFGAEEGLFCIKNGKIQNVKLLGDPASNFINFVNYKEGKLFVGTNNGLFVISELDKRNPRIQRYGKGDGLVELETNLNSGFFDNEGVFWFGTAAGLISFHPNVQNSIPSIPKIRVKEILLNYQAFNYRRYSDKLSAFGLPENLNLPYSKNNLIFELDGISLLHHDGLMYQFFLEGINDTWSPLSENSSITFTSLPAGDYNLQIRAIDVDGRMSPVISFPFVINAAFYKTWWFISIIIASIVLLSIAAFRFRLKRINEINEKERLGFENKLISLEQKSVNASMNRHFIFNALNSIQYFINTQDRLAANKYLTNFAQLIRKNLDAATSEKNAITLEEEIERLKLYLSLESMRFNGKFKYEIINENVDCESIEIPSMILQPFIENSIIHGVLPNEDKFGEIYIHLSLDEDVLTIKIEDNGVGVKKSLSSKLEMEGDHKSQGMEITSKRIELLKKVSNNEIELIGPLQIESEDGLINGTRVLIKIRLSDLEN